MSFTHTVLWSGRGRSHDARELARSDDGRAQLAARQRAPFVWEARPAISDASLR